jgi:hypothetical protein
MSWGKKTAAIILPAFIVKAVVCSVLFMLAAPAAAQPPCHKEKPQEQCIDACKTVSQEASGDRFVLPEPPVSIVVTVPLLSATVENLPRVVTMPPRTRLLALQILLI